MKLRKLALAAIAMLAVTGCSPMKSTYSVEIKQTPAKVFVWITEPDRIKLWLGGLKETQILTEGGLRVGARDRMILEMPEGKYVMETEVLDFQADKFIKVKATVPEGFDQVIVYTLEDIGGATRLTFESETDMKHWMANVMLPLWWPDAEKKMQSDLAKLKELAETRG